MIEGLVFFSTLRVTEKKKLHGTEKNCMSFKKLTFCFKGLYGEDDGSSVWGKGCKKHIIIA